MASWKTSLFGFLALLPQLWQAVMPSLSIPQEIANVITAVMGAIAFYCAKDKNVTGGTVSFTGQKILNPSCVETKSDPK